MDKLNEQLLAYLEYLNAQERALWEQKKACLTLLEARGLHHVSTVTSSDGESKPVDKEPLIKTMGRKEPAVAKTKVVSEHRGRVGKTAEQKREIVEGIIAMLNDGASLNEARGKFKVSDASYYIWAKELGIERPTLGKGRNGGKALDNNLNSSSTHRIEEEFKEELEDFEPEHKIHIPLEERKSNWGEKEKGVEYFDPDKERFQ